MNVSIGDRWQAFVDELVRNGRYGSVSEVVREALRLVEEREAKLRALREALAEGEQSGKSVPFDFDEFVTRKRRSGVSSAS